MPAVRQSEGRTGQWLLACVLRIAVIRAAVASESSEQISSTDITVITA
jgi:hypothetical protein